MKISDTFNLPVYSEEHMSGWYIVVENNGTEIAESGDGGWSEVNAKAAAHAINNYDSLVDALQQAIDILYSIDDDPAMTNKMSHYDVDDLRELNNELIKAQS